MSESKLPNFRLSGTSNLHTSSQMLLTYMDCQGEGHRLLTNCSKAAPALASATIETHRNLSSATFSHISVLPPQFRTLLGRHNSGRCSDATIPDAARTTFRHVSVLSTRLLRFASFASEESSPPWQANRRYAMAPARYLSSQTSQLRRQKTANLC